MKRSEREKLLLWEKRIVFLAFVCGILASFLFVISFSTEYWVYVKFTRSMFRNDTGREPYYKTGHYHGLWRICREEYRNFTDELVTAPPPEHSMYCRAMWFSLPDHIKPEFRAVENQILDFRRSTVAVGFISIVLSGIANCFVYFSLGQLRYMFKRLSGCLQLITGASAWVTIEVFKQSVYFEERHMKHNITHNSHIQFGWSYNLVWMVLMLYVFDGVVMIVCSRKRKGVKARSMKEARENEPVHLGRI